MGVGSLCSCSPRLSPQNIQPARPSLPAMEHHPGAAAVASALDKLDLRAAHAMAYDALAYGNVRTVRAGGGWVAPACDRRPPKGGLRGQSELCFTLRLV